MPQQKRQFSDRVRMLLEEPGPLPVSAMEPLLRTHDDHDGTFEGTLCVQMGRDGDMWVIPMGNESLRFRVPEFGGGSSPLTHAALRILAYAISLDNKEHPQSRG